MPRQTFQEHYPIALRSAKVRSAAAATSGHIADSERPDLEQDLVIAAWRALPSYDPLRSTMRTFTERVVANTFKSFIRQRQRHPRFESLEELHLAALNVVAQLELRIDVQRVVTSLGERDQLVAWALMELKPAATCRRLRITHASLYRSIRRLRVAFLNAGLGNRRRHREASA